MKKINLLGLLLAPMITFAEDVTDFMAKAKCEEVVKKSSYPSDPMNMYLDGLVTGVVNTSVIYGKYDEKVTKESTDDIKFKICKEMITKNTFKEEIEKYGFVDAFTIATASYAAKE